MPAAPEYAELHCHSRYSLLAGASQPEEPVAPASALGLGVVATNDVRAPPPAGRARRHPPPPAARRRPHAEYDLKDAAALARRFAALPEAVRPPLVIAARCQARGQRAAYRFPACPLPPGETPDSYLAARCRAGALARYGHADGEVGAKRRYELELIARQALAGYFLIVWDPMEFTRRERIPAPGRGSAAHSIVAYVLGLTNVDPSRHKLFVGRFLNEELATLPDSDIDCSREHREPVLQYVDSRYGRAPAALVSTHITYHSRSAVRDVGKALGLPPDALDRRARQLERPRPHPPAPLPCQRRRGWLGGRRSASCLWSGGGSPRRLPRALPLL